MSKVFAIGKNTVWKINKQDFYLSILLICNIDATILTVLLICPIDLWYLYVHTS